MSQHTLVRRDEMVGATLRLGGQPIELADYATTGLIGVGIGPPGSGKTNAGLLMAEQLSQQGWISVLIDPESVMEQLYGEAVADAEELRQRLTLRDKPIVVVRAHDATGFIPYGEVIRDVAERDRKPLFVVIDEGQLFSSPRKRKDGIGEAADLVNDFTCRGRKRALDLYVTAHRFAGTVHRSIFGAANLKLFGCQEDPTTWSALAPQFRGSNIGFNDLNALGPGEFFCLSRRGFEKLAMPMAEKLKAVAPAAKPVKRMLPKTFSQWDRAMRQIATERLEALTDPIVALLGSVAGLTAQQMIAGQTALQDELGSRV